jgi:8-oxo-dGTP pyrophosphatase MutT (NUDIX family)
MHRQPLLNALKTYRKLWLDRPEIAHQSYDAGEEKSIISKFETFIHSTPQCFDRSHLAGHITGSALVVSEDFREVLLTLHAKLGMWLQLGGHADGHHLVHEVARTEVQEESGLRDFWFQAWNKRHGGASKNASILCPEYPVPFDLDAHWIPPNKKDEGHWHYDVRYVIVASRNQPIAITAESHDLRWFNLDAARKITSERSMHRQFDKIAAFSQST